MRSRSFLPSAPGGRLGRREEGGGASGTLSFCKVVAEAKGGGYALGARRRVPPPVRSKLHATVSQGRNPTPLRVPIKLAFLPTLKSMLYVHVAKRGLPSRSRAHPTLRLRAQRADFMHGGGVAGRRLHAKGRAPPFMRRRRGGGAPAARAAARRGPSAPSAAGPLDPTLQGSSWRPSLPSAR